jgi:hypothetical protein
MFSTYAKRYGFLQGGMVRLHLRVNQPLGRIDRNAREDGSTRFQFTSTTDINLVYVLYTYNCASKKKEQKSCLGTRIRVIYRD